MPIYKDYNSLFKAINRDLEKTLEEVSEHIRKLWYELVEEEFYNKYSPTEYQRTYETLNSLTSFGVVRNGNKFSVDIGYDESKITTIIPRSSYSDWGTHNEPSMQGMLIEEGWIMPNGDEREGAHAYEDMLLYINSKSFMDVFCKKLRNYGYDVKLK